MSEFQLDNLQTLVDKAIALLREHEPPEGYFMGFSGGKDSVVIKRLAEIAGVKFEGHYHVTQIDPPELTRFIREKHPDVIWDKNKKHFFKAIEVKGWPSFRVRWCCVIFKESKTPKGRIAIFGVRAAESARRAAKWSEKMIHKQSNSICLNPIFSWTDMDVWDFIRQYNVQYCCLYDEGFTRLGCVGCPLAGKSKRLRAWERWPRYHEAWKKACRKYWDSKNGDIFYGVFATFEEAWQWYAHDRGTWSELKELRGIEESDDPCGSQGTFTFSELEEGLTDGPEPEQEQGE